MTRKTRTPAATTATPTALAVLDPELDELESVEQLDDTDDGVVIDDEMIDAALETLIEDVAADIEIDLDTFDIGEYVDDLDIYDTDGAMRKLEEIRAPYVRAARRAGKRSPAAEFYNVVNAPLFVRRINLQTQVDTLAITDEADRDMVHTITVRRAARQLEAITDLIVRFNYGMTRSYVKKFTSNTSRDDSEDFQGAATLGLMRAISTFDPAKGRFGSWAFKPIQREVLRAVRDADFVNMNPGDFERRPDILRAYTSLAGPNGEYTPTHTEVAAACAVKVTVEQVARVLDAPYLESLHTHVGEDGDTELGDLIPDTAGGVEDTVIGGLGVAALMDYGLTALDSREHFVLVRRYGLDGEPAQCLSSIGEQLKLSREAVRQIEAKGLAKLLHPCVLRRLQRNGRP